MKVFFDTNVIVAALTARGLCAHLLRLALEEHEALTGAVNLVELARTLRDKFDATPERIATATAVFERGMVVPKPDHLLAINMRDPDDAWVLASAVAAGADVLVSGDKDLLAIAAHAPLPILSPRAAWERLRSPGSTE